MSQNLSREQIEQWRSCLLRQVNHDQQINAVNELCDLALSALDRQDVSNAELNKHYILGWNDALYSAGELFRTGGRYQYTRPQAFRLCNSQRRPLPPPPSQQGREK